MAPKVETPHLMVTAQQ